MKISQNYALDVDFFEWCGWQYFDVWDFSCSMSFEGDHSPGIYIIVAFLGVRIMDFSIYNVNHIG